MFSNIKYLSLTIVCFAIAWGAKTPDAFAESPSIPSQHYLDDDTMLNLDDLEKKYKVYRPALAPKEGIPLKNMAPDPQNVPIDRASPSSRQNSMPWDALPASNHYISSISVSDLQQLATQHNPTLKILRQQIRAAHGEFVQAGLKPNPTLAYESEEIGDGGKAGKHGFVLEQELITGGKRKLDRAAASWETEQTRRRCELQCHAIQNDVRARAYELLAAQRIVEINRKLTDIARQSVSAAENLGRAGEVSRIDLLQIRAKANEAQASLVAAVNEESLAWKKLAVMVGMKDLEPHFITDSLECPCPINRDAAWQTVLQCSPQLAVLQAKIQQAQCNLARERAERMPDITVGGGIAYDYGERQTLGSFSVAVPLQIYDRNKGNIQKAHAELAAAHQELNRKKLELYENFSDRYASLNSAQQQIRLYKERIIPDVQEALELSLQGYKNGEYGYMDVLSAQQLFLESQTQYIQALKEHALCCAYLDGFLAEGGLSESGE